MSGSFVGGLVGILLSAAALCIILVRPRNAVREDLAGLRVGAAMFIVLNAFLAAIALVIDLALGGTSSLLVGLTGGIVIGGSSLVIAKRWLDVATPPLAAGESGQAGREPGPRCCWLCSWRSPPRWRCSSGRSSRSDGRTAGAGQPATVPQWWRRTAGRRSTRSCLAPSGRTSRSGSGGRSRSRRRSRSCLTTPRSSPIQEPTRPCSPTMASCTCGMWRPGSSA